MKSSRGIWPLYACIAAILVHDGTDIYALCVYVCMCIIDESRREKNTREIRPIANLWHKLWNNNSRSSSSSTHTLTRTHIESVESRHTLSVQWVVRQQTECVYVCALRVCLHVLCKCICVENCPFCCCSFSYAHTMNFPPSALYLCLLA